LAIKKLVEAVLVVAELIKSLLLLLDGKIFNGKLKDIEDREPKNVET
jgi:hypothetical protein